MTSANSFRLIMLSAWWEQGGNVLQRHLDGHPSLFVYPFESRLGTPGSTSLIDSAAVPTHYRYPSFATDLTPEQAYASIEDGELKTYLRTPERSKFRDCGLLMDEKARVEAFVDHYADLTPLDEYGDPLQHPQRRDYIEAFFRSTFAAWSNRAASGTETHYVGYSPPILFGADAFFRDFPEGHMVHVIRNPFSGYADTLKRPFPRSLEAYCQLWNLTSLTALTYARKYPGRFHLVQYEMLVADKEKTMRALLTALGLPWSDAVMYPSFNGVKLDPICPWGTIKAATTEANDATALELTEGQTKEVFAECSVILSLLRYT